MKELKPPFEWRKIGDDYHLGFQGEAGPLRFYSREDANFLASKAGLKYFSYVHRAVIFNGLVCWNVEAVETDG